jgi:ribosomal protein L7/L12
MINVLLAAVIGAGLALGVLVVLKLIFRKDKNATDYSYSNRQQAFSQSTELYDPELRTKKNIRAAAKDFKLIGEISGLIAGGSKLEAIKIVQEREQIPLEDAKKVVEMAEDIMKKMPGLFDYKGQPTDEYSNVYADPSSALDTKLKTLIGSGNMIAAIKVYRDATECGLAEAKAYCEEFAHKNNLQY